MSPAMRFLALAVCLFGAFLVASAAGKTASDDAELASILQDSELASAVGDDSSIETALLNYLFAKQIVSRLRNNVNAHDLIKKRTYWKQCAFNAVSCFGK